MHAKLLAAFLGVAALLLVLAGVSVLVQRHMNDRVAELDLAQQRLDHLRQMLYLITAQTHYRTMALLTSERVLALYEAQRGADALELHLSEERPLSHNIENPVGLLLNDAEFQMESSQAVYVALPR